MAVHQEKPRLNPQSQDKVVPFTMTQKITKQGSFPETLIIVGAGVFGLSTALAVARRYPSTKVIVVDRLTPPVVDGSSVDTTRCIRAGKLHDRHMLYVVELAS
jgi:pyruvate/2-oxoglutarate dehydrogenase complex dihydrolipoamide dehydrogenase (E3) component